MEEWALAKEQLIVYAGYLGHFDDEVDDWKGHFNYIYVEVQEHSLDLVNT